MKTSKTSASRKTPETSTASSATKQMESIEINARYYLCPSRTSDWPLKGSRPMFDVIDRTLEYNFKPAVVFSNGTEADCREWVLRNCEEPVGHTLAPWEVVRRHPNPRTARLYLEILRVGHHSSIAIAEQYNADDPEQTSNANLIAAAPKLLALLEQYHSSFPTKESGKLIAEARGWQIQE